MIDVHTTSCPASSSSLFISAAIGADDTATGVPNKAIRAGKHILLSIPKKVPLLFKRYATTRHAIGTISIRARVPAIICFLSLEIALKVKSPPKASKARGDAISFKLLIVVYKKGTLSLIVNSGVSLPIESKALNPKNKIPRQTPIIKGFFII